MKNIEIIKQYPWLFSENHFSKSFQNEFVLWYNKIQEFNKKIIEPISLELDKAYHLNHDEVPEHVLKAACEYNLFSCWLPKSVGGQEINILTYMMIMEQLSKACIGLGNLIYVPGLAIAALLASGKSSVFMPLLSKIVQEEKKGNAIVLALAITEPSGGSDLQSPERQHFSSSVSTCKKTDGGYVLNATKVFISDAAAADYMISIFWEDKKDRASSLRLFLIPRDQEGQHIGKNENKMGVKACSANEVLYDDCFVPDEFQLLDPSLNLNISFESILGITRTGVGAIAIGGALSSLEIAKKYASENYSNGESLIQQSWVKHKLAKMWRNVQMSRALIYNAAMLQFEFGIFDALYGKTKNVISKFPALPQEISSTSVYQKMVLESPLTQMYILSNVKAYKKERAHIATDMASNCKVSASEIAMENAQLGMDICGVDGLRHDLGLEKILRDVKLLQIYEGSNQICDLEIFELGMGE